MMQLTVRDALATLGERGETYVKLFARSALDIALYKPDRIDPQTPHLRDEIYVIACGSVSSFRQTKPATLPPATSSSCRKVSRTGSRVSPMISRPG